MLKVKPTLFRQRSTNGSVMVINRRPGLRCLNKRKKANIPLWTGNRILRQSATSTQASSFWWKPDKGDKNLRLWKDKGSLSQAIVAERYVTFLFEQRNPSLLLIIITQSTKNLFNCLRRIVTQNKRWFPTT